MKKYENTKFGDYIITKYLGGSTWEAVCEKCGLTRKYSTQTLTAKIGKAGQCTCSASGVEPGEKYGRLTVLYRDLSRAGEGRVAWVCECECGNQLSVISKSLKDGNTRSCGCLNDDVRRQRVWAMAESTWKEMPGRRSGMLVVIRKATKEETAGRPLGNGYWLCACDCGNHHIVSTSDFTQQKVQSCGCMNSKGEAKITKLLEDNNICFQKQYAFNDLRGKKDNKYYFDFAVFDGQRLIYLIEYDGIQHFSKRHQFSQDEDVYDIIVERDSEKNAYCIENNIPLIRIPYTHFEKLAIEDLRLETSKFIYKKEGNI